MIGLHTTRDGAKIPIAMMEDSHLINTIRLMFKQANAERNAVQLPAFVAGYQRQNKDFIALATQALTTGHNSLYIMEALRRDNTRKAILDIIGVFFPELANTKQYTAPQTLALLNAGDDDDDEIDWNASNDNVEDRLERSVNLCFADRVASGEY